MMGIETVLLGASLAISAVSTIGQISAQRQAKKAREKSASADREARNVSTASQQIQDAANRRRLAKEERIRRARIVQSSVNSGAAESSGQFGATSSLASSFGSSRAQQQTQILAAKGISKQSQVAADARADEADAITRGKTIGALGDLGQSIVGGIYNAYGG